MIQLNNKEKLVKNKSLFALLLAISYQANAVVLISGSEASLPTASGIVQTRGNTRGPGISLVSPVNGESVKSPFDLKINFEAHGGVKIDPASVSVTYLRSPLVDLTPRLIAGVTPAGIALSRAEVPPGEHQISIRVKDAEGRESHAIIDLKVAP